jgi:hypothetical protein
MVAISINHIEDLKSTKTSLTVVDGIGEKIAEKLRAGGIITIMALSMTDPKRLTYLDIPSKTAITIVKNSQTLVDTVAGGDAVTTEETQEVDELSIKTKTITLNGREITISERDEQNAAILGKPVEDYMLMDNEIRDRDLRIAKSLVTPDPNNVEEIDHFAQELDLGKWNAPEFVKEREKQNAKLQHQRKVDKNKVHEKTASFVDQIVHGEPVDDSSNNVNPLSKNVDQNPPQEVLDTEVYIPNRKKKETRGEALEAQKKSVRDVIDNLL